MTDLLLSVNMTLSIFVDQLLTMGLPVIDKSLDELMNAMKQPITNGLFGEMTNMASGLGICFALCVGSYECWMMILGRRGIDVMKILRIIGLAICIHPLILKECILPAMDKPGDWLESRTHSMATASNKQVAILELAVAKKQQEYVDSLRSQQAKQEEKKAAQDAATEDGLLDKIQHSVENIGNSIKNYAQQAAVLVETKISEWANDIIRFIGEIIFQMTYYGMLVGQRIFLSVLKLFCPVMFALSIVPPWRSAWSQWISKYLTVSLWGFLVAVGVAAGAVTGGASTAASVAGAYNQSRSSGGSVTSSIVGSVISNTGIGQHYAAGGDRARSYNNVGKNDENYKRKDNQ